jgi:Aldo/keto reductase family
MSLLNRREFIGLCVAFGPFTAASALDLASSTASATAGRTVKFRDGTVVSALGQGSAGLGKGKRPQAEEQEALRTGLSLGMTLIDTAEMYGSEEFIGRAIAGQRDGVFLVSKVSPNHVGDGVFAARRPRRQVAARSHACTDRCSTWLLSSRCCSGLDHPQRQCHGNSRIRFGGACEGERRRALTDTDTAGYSNTGGGVSAAQALGRDLSSRRSLYPQKRTFSCIRPMSAKGQKRTNAPQQTTVLFNSRVGAAERCEIGPGSNNKEDVHDDWGRYRVHCA